MHLRTCGCDVFAAHAGEGSFLALVLDGISVTDRARGCSVSRKLPLTWQMLCQLAPSLGVSHVELLAILGVGVAFMLRGSELVLCPRSKHHLLVRDVRFDFASSSPGAPYKLELTVKSSKTSPVPVKRIYRAHGTTLCVVAWLWRHWCALGARPPPSARLFPGFTRSTLLHAHAH